MSCEISVTAAGTTVVVGAGVAGVRTVQGLVRRAYPGRIVVIGSEPHAPYDRPPLSKEVLHSGMPLPVLLPEAAELGPEVEWRTGVTAVGLEVAERRVMTDDGFIAYDSIVIATGAEARRVPGLPGLVLRTWDDAQAMREALRENAAVTIIGAGLIGCEVAASARKLGARVHLVDVLDGPMTRVVGPSLAHAVADLHREHDVEFHLSTSVADVDGCKVVLSDGASFPTDVLLHAIGATPSTSWLADSGLDVTDGVRCDERGRTAAPGVYAVGDVAAWAGVRSEHWSSAIEQAAVVASVITGQEPGAIALPYWWSDQYDVKFQGLGRVSSTDEVRIRVWGPAPRTIALYGSGGRLVGVVGLSAAKAVMGLRRDIVAGTQLDDVAARFEDL